MNGRIRAPLGTEYLVSAIGEDFVAVHVVRSSSARLIHIDNELVPVFSGQHFVGSLYDRVGKSGFQSSGFFMRERRSSLDLNRCIDKSRHRPQAAYRKIPHGAQSLHPV